MGARRLFLTGALVGGVAVCASLFLRVAYHTAYLPELASSALFSLVPGFLESQAVENLGPLAKDTAFVVASILNALVLGGVPVIFQRFAQLKPNKARMIGLFTASGFVIMLALGQLFLSLTQVSTQPVSLELLALSLLVPSVVFGVGLGMVNLSPRTLVPPTSPMERMKGRFSKKRRLFVKSTVGAAIGAVILYYGVGLLFPKQSPLVPAKEVSQILASQVTPNDEFYRVDINVFSPSVDANSWSLKVHGLVSNPVTLDYNGLLSLPAVEEYATLECVSSKVGDKLMSTALWKGVRLSDILSKAAVGADANYLVFTCYDGYDVGMPLERAMADGTILAYEMNGQTLPQDHGYPVRAIVPGLYGMMNAKWITGIELVSGVYDGFWQRRGWTNTASYQTGSTIITPGGSPLRERFSLPGSLTEVAGSPVDVLGVAFAGDRGIRKVEVSTDGGSSWQPASLYDPLSKYTWVFWKYEWNPPSSGDYRIMARATDGTGAVQVATLTDPFPDGVTGLDAVDVTVQSK